MASSVVEVPVFTDTNLGTHIAMAVSPDITAGEFKRELESEHLNCFPNLGEIRVNGLMVKRKSRFYHLPESFPIKHAFQGVKGTICIYMEACLWKSYDKPCLLEHMAEEVWDHISSDGNATSSLEFENCFASTKKNNTKCKRKKRRIKRFHGLQTVLQKVLRAGHFSKKKKKKKRVNNNCFLNYPVKGLEEHLDRNEGTAAEERFDLFVTRTENEHVEDWNSIPLVETSCETLSESVSVSGIIKKYFSNYDEVTSNSEVNFEGIQNRLEGQLKARTGVNCSNIQIDTTPQCTAKTPPRMILFPMATHLSSGTSTGVGKRLVMASNNLRISASKQKPAISLCRSGDGKLRMPNSSLIRSLVFEINDKDD